MDEESMESAFSKFGRGRKAKGGGLGLGLAICRGIAEAHGGSVRVSNASGGGLLVEAFLPAAKGGPA
jgi:two-component system sensor histidine kinase KdpD